MKKNTTYKCSICGKGIVGLGNDPRPIRDSKDDLCCDECEVQYVQPPKRLFDYLNRFATRNDVVLRFDGYYIGVKRRFGCWEYWIADDNEDNIEQGVYEDDFAPITQVVKELMEKHHIPPAGFELLEPDPYYMMEYI